MNNWIDLVNEVGEKCKVLINLNSGIIVEQVILDDRYVTRISSLHNNDRYLQGESSLYDRVKLAANLIK